MHKKARETWLGSVGLWRGTRGGCVQGPLGVSKGPQAQTGRQCALGKEESTTPYDPSPYIVKETHGSLITATRDKVVRTREA